MQNYAKKNKKPPPCYLVSFTTRREASYCTAKLAKNAVICNFNRCHLHLSTFAVNGVGGAVVGLVEVSGR